MIYEPAEDSFLLEKIVKESSAGKKVLDVGCGSGILSIAAREGGAKKILSVDIDKEAVKKVRSLGIRAKESNLFSKVKGKFDLIVFNPPYLPKDDLEDKESSKVTTGGVKGDELIIKFLKKADKYLEKDGVILLLVSSLTPTNRIELILKQKEMDFEIIACENLFMEKLKVLKITKKLKDKNNS